MRLSRLHRMAVFITISIALFMSTFDGTIVATALVALQHDLKTSITWAGWTITAYSLGMIMALALAGKLSERYGRRRVFLASVIIFTLASLGCAMAPNIYVLIVLRIVQAVGGAGFTPSATGIIVDRFGSSRDKAVGFFGSIFTIGAMIGPIAGGFIVHYLSWHWVFLVNVPIGLLLIPMTLKFIPRDPKFKKRKRAKVTIDLVGAGLLGGSMLALMTGLALLDNSGAEILWLCSAAFAVGILAFIVFLQRIRYAKYPIIVPELLYGRNFGAVNIINVFYCGAVGGLVVLIPLYAITRYNIDVVDAGSLLAAQALGALVFASVSVLALRRTGYRKPILVGAVLVIAGMIMMSQLPIGMSPYTWLSVAAAIIGVGSGIISPASRNAGLQLVPKHAPSLAALRTTGVQVGIISAVSIVTVIIDHADSSATALAWVFAFFPLLLLVILPVIRRIPEHRGFW